MNDYYFIGQIISLGKNGFVKVNSSVDQIDQYFNVNKIVFLEFWGKKKKIIVEETLRLKNSFFVKFFNFNDDRHAQVLIGRKVFDSEIKNAEGIKKQITEFDICPLCKSEMTKDHIKEVFDDCDKKVLGFNKQIQEAKKDIEKLTKTISESKQKLTEEYLIHKKYKTIAVYI